MHVPTDVSEPEEASTHKSAKTHADTGFLTCDLLTFDHKINVIDWLIDLLIDI